MLKQDVISIPDTPEVLHAPPRGVSPISRHFETSNPHQHYMSPADMIAMAATMLTAHGGSGELLAEFYRDVVAARTSDEIADCFRSQGIKGDRNLMNACPIAEYSKRSGIDADIDQDGIKYVIGDTAFRIGHTPATRDFIERFDRGDFPDLVR